MVEQLPDVLHIFATCLPVVADVPKIFWTQERLGDCLRQPQMADQLVEVPTIMSFPSLQRIVVQFSVAEGEVWLRPGKGSTARIVEQTVDISVSCSGGLQGFLPRQGSTASSFFARSCSCCG